MKAVDRSLMGRIHSVESGGTVDGPGIRFVLFFQGCPLRCQYCHNPDSLLIRDGEERSVGELLDEIATYADFVKRAKGGVTFSGGEPLMQPEFLKELLRGCKEMGLHTCIDTSGFFGAKADEELLSLVDLVLLDIKSFDPETYERTTAAQLEPTLEFAERLEERNISTWVRFVLVPGLTDAEENIRGLADYVSGLSNVEKVEILPFHQMAEYKWEELGVPYMLKDTRQATDADVKRARDLFLEYGVRGI